MVIVFHHQSYQQPHQTPDCSVFWNINIFGSFLFLLFIKYFLCPRNIGELSARVWQMSLLSSEQQHHQHQQQCELQWKKSYWQYLIECHSRAAVTKSHTTKIVAGSYCTKMSVICVKSSSFVWHERIIIILYRMCIWYLRGWTRPE